MPRNTVVALLCIAVLSIAAPLCWEQLDTAIRFWLNGPPSTTPFSAESNFRNQMVAVALTTAGLMTPIGLLAVAVRNLHGPTVLQTLLDGLAVLCLIGFVGSQMLLYNQFGGTLRHLGQTSMAIHSGTAFCFVSMFVIYRMFESRMSGGVHRSMFELQLGVMCCGPVLYRVAYGLWFTIAGHAYDGLWLQQILLSFGFFLLPLLLIYIGSSVYRGRTMVMPQTLVVSGLILAAIIIGLRGHDGSSIQPEFVRHRPLPATLPA